MEVSEDKLNDMLRKVQAMLARADHPNTPPAEAETARRMAGELMEKYRIDEAMFQETMPLDHQLVPAWRTWTVCSSESLYAGTYRDLCTLAINHFECRAVYASSTADDGWVWKAEVCGYESDLRMAEVLYTSMMLAFQQAVEPKVNPELPDAVNAYFLRKAGMEGWRVADAIYGAGAGQNKSKRSKVRKMFKDEAIRRGENPDALLGSTDVKQFRKDYADAFEMESWSRLERMRTMRGEFSQGLVLMSRKEKVQEVFYERYPQFRPKSGSNLPYVSPQHGCERCAKAKSGYCQEHAYLKPKKAEAPRRHNSAAAMRGREAARQVDLGATPDGRRLEDG